MSLELINCAFDFMGLPPLTSNQKSDKLDLAERNLPKAIAETLRRINWTEETITTCLDEVMVCNPCCDLPEGYCFAFAVPKDFVTGICVTSRSDGKGCCKSRQANVQWKPAKIKVKGGVKNVIITDQCPVNLEYICKPTDPCQLDESIQDLIAMNLAMRMTYSIKSDMGMRDRIERDYERKLEIYGSISAGQDNELHVIPNGFLLAPRVGNRNVLEGASGSHEGYPAASLDPKPRSGRAGEHDVKYDSGDIFNMLFGGSK